MSLQTELDRIEGAKADIAAAITEKGVTVPATTKLDGMAALISSIEAGGGSTEERTSLTQIYKGTITGNGTTSFTITHNTGIVPLVVKIAINTTGGTYLVRYIYTIKDGDRADTLYCGYASSSSNVKGGTVSSVPDVWDETSVKITVSNSLNFASGKVYNVYMYV